MPAVISPICNHHSSLSYCVAKKCKECNNWVQYVLPHQPENSEILKSTVQYKKCSAVREPYWVTYSLIQKIALCGEMQWHSVQQEKMPFSQCGMQWIGLVHTCSALHFIGMFWIAADCFGVIGCNWENWNLHHHHSNIIIISIIIHGRHCSKLLCSGLKSCIWSRCPEFQVAGFVFLDTERFQSISIVFMHQEYQYVNTLSTPWKQHTYRRDDGTDNVDGKHDDHNDSVCFLDESNISPPVAYQIPRMCIH